MSKELEEAIKELEDWRDTIQTLDENNKGARAIETVLQALEKLENENEILNKERKYVKYELNNSISKQVIKEKMLKINLNPNNAHQKVSASQIDASLISCLQELLEGK